jgi:integrase
MPRRTHVPTYRLHKQSGQAVVTLPDGLGGRRDVLLGPHGTPESRAEYARVLAEWEAAGRRLPPRGAEPSAPDLTVNELILAYWKHVEAYYVKDGRPTSEQDTIRQALRFLKRLYGDTPAAAFGPLALKAVREAMVEHPVTRKVKVKDPETGAVREEVRVLRQGLSRRFINKQVDRVRRLFAWAVEQELVPVAVHQALQTVAGLRRGKGQAREKPPVRPVAEEVVDATLPHLPAAVADMVRVQRLAGMRPQEVVLLRPCDLDMTGPVWEYRPPRYKTEHHNDDDVPERERVVFLGPRAQETLRCYLPLSTAAYFFDPRLSEGERARQRRRGRKTPLWPSHLRHQERKRKPRKAALRDHYDVASYRRAIRRACLKHGLPHWFPNQLRHSRGTEIRKRYGLEASQAVLGHSELGVTQVYAEVDRETARRIMGEVG